LAGISAFDNRGIIWSALAYEHRYFYACADPIDRIDPSGLSAARNLLIRSLALGGFAVGGEQSAEEVDALLDYGVNLRLRAKDLENELAIKFGLPVVQGPEFWVYGPLP
jgi:hypothetical protein